MLEALGLDFITQLPVLNLGNKSSDTDYIDFIKPKDLEGHPVVRGVDCDGRHFISFNLLEVNMSHSVVLTLFQRRTNESLWVPGNEFGFLGFQSFITYPETLKTLCASIIEAPQDIKSVFQSELDGEIDDRHTLNVQLIQPTVVTAELIQRDFPDYMIEALGLEYMLKLPVLPLGDRTSANGDAIDFITTRNLDNNMCIGWNHEKRPFICFTVKKFDGHTRDTLLILFKTKNNTWDFCHNRATRPTITPVDCGLGKFLTDTNITKTEKVNLLKPLLNPKFPVEVVFNDDPNSKEKLSLPTNFERVGNNFTIEPSLHERYQKLLRGEIEMDLEEDLNNDSNSDQHSVIKTAAL